MPILSALRPHLGHIALTLWGGLAISLLNNSPYGLDEGGAKALLLAWSIADQVASTVVTLGAPDLRALLLLPIGFLWTGSLIAAKVFSVILVAITISLSHAWATKRFDPETALIGSGLLAISPLLLFQIDALLPGVYLLLAIILGVSLDHEYRQSPRPFGGLFFFQLFACSLSVSLHPAGLAYPLALFLSWKSQPVDVPQQKQFLIGISATVFLTLLLKMGWGDLAWLSNPLLSLSGIFLDAPINNESTLPRLVSGGIACTALLVVMLMQARSLWSDLIGRTLIFSVILGLTAADSTWALICFFLVLYYGLPLLLQSTKLGLLARPLVLLLTIIGSTIFMQSDRAHLESRQSDALSHQDQVIKLFATEVETARKAADEGDRNSEPPAIRAASQWPSRTMIACRCDTLPLPPTAKDPDAQLAMIRGISYVIFDPKDKANIDLAHNFAYLGPTAFETTALEIGGVVLHRR